MPDKTEILKVKGLCKSFGGRRVLNQVDIVLNKGEILGLAGHNGAGKSVLIKTLSGIYRPDSGEIFYEGRNAYMKNAHEAQEWGYFVVPQEMNLARQLSVSENIFLGRKEISNNAFGLVNYKYIHEESKRLLWKYFNIDIDPRVAVGELDSVTQRVIQVVRCLCNQAKVIVFDETTAGLAQHEREKLFIHIKALAKKGLGIIFVSHMISEMIMICDSVTTLRNGENVGSRPVADLDEHKLVEMIVGREHKIPDYIKSEPEKDNILCIRNATSKNKHINDVCFNVRKGEILGIYGLRNQGQNLLLDMIYGAYQYGHVQVELNGKKLNIKNPSVAVKNGLAFLPERGYKTVFNNKAITDNMVIQQSIVARKNIFINKSVENTLVRDQIEKFSVRGCASINNNLCSLSGGNMQKILLARTMMNSPQILMLMEPTQGIDIGAKEEVKKLILKVACEGRGVIIVTSEIDDIIDICNRTIILRDGRLMAEYEADTKNKSAIVKCCSGC